MDARKRKRGIRASREKLEAAMLNAGFDTQTDLAKCIAMNEGIDKPPKDLVNKVFREQAVSTHNLARIANALGISAHTIYLARDDKEFEAVIEVQQSESGIENSQYGKPESTAIKQDSRIQTENSLALECQETHSNHTACKPKGLIYEYLHKKRSAHFVFVSLFACAVYGFLSYQSNTFEDTSTKIETPLGAVRLIVQAPNSMKVVADKLVQRLNTHENITVVLASSPNSYDLEAQEALLQWQAHAVLKLAQSHYGNYTRIEAMISTSQDHAVLHQSILHQSEIALGAGPANVNIVQQVLKFINGESTDTIDSGLAAAVDYFAKGKDALFLSHSADAYETAITLFNHAVLEDVDYAIAYAELCRAFARYSWIKNESESLEKAAVYCNKAEQISPNVLSVATARAELLIHIGEARKAVNAIEAVIVPDLEDADSLSTWARAYLSLYNQSSNSDDADRAEQLALKALHLAPRHWHAINTLGNLYFARGETGKAKEQFAAASKVVKHEIILANLGTLQMCFGELENAVRTYQDVVDNFQNDYIGYENLGSVYFYQNRYKQAAEQKLLAIQKQPEIAIHQVWGSLGEVYLRMGSADEALRYYTEALVVTERDQLMQNANVNIDFHKFYYQTKIKQIKHDFTITDDFVDKVKSFFNQKNQLGLKERSHLAWLAYKAGEGEKGQILWQEISQVCPIYKRSPELLAQIASPT